jgi:myo-inositol 2-dehydrogenase / D-chiro-inositol 1-dehydrogenase
MDRRTFMIMTPQVVRGTMANSAVRVGLLGCGGRGTEDATSIATNGGGRIVALADLNQDQLERAKAHFDKLAPIDAKQVFRGPHAVDQIVASKEVDAIVIATPPYFHPQHLAAVIDANKHVYCEKPVAVDVAGAKRVIDIGRRAEGRVSLDVGFQIRSAPPFVELVKRIHAGALGEIAFGTAYYLCPTIDRPAWPGASAEQLRLRNWIYDRRLSGDIIVEQNIHVIDICNWVLRGHPERAIAVAGRKGRTDNGDCNGHYSATFWYPNDVHVSFSSRQFGKEGFDANERFFGTLGSSQSPYAGTVGIAGDRPWTWGSGENKGAAGGFSATGSFGDNLAQADAVKHKTFIESITSGKFHNQAALGAESSLSAMLGRKAAELKRVVTWDELVRSDESWDPGIDVNKLA